MLEQAIAGAFKHLVAGRGVPPAAAAASAEMKYHH
jgi:hypothetical protein